MFAWVHTFFLNTATHNFQLAPRAPPAERMIRGDFGASRRIHLHVNKGKHIFLILLYGKDTLTMLKEHNVHVEIFGNLMHYFLHKFAHLCEDNSDLLDAFLKIYFLKYRIFLLRNINITKTYIAFLSQHFWIQNRKHFYQMLICK